MQAALKMRWMLRIAAPCVALMAVLACWHQRRPAPTWPMSRTRKTTPISVIDTDKMETVKTIRSASGRAASTLTRDGKFVLVCAR